MRESKGPSEKEVKLIEVHSLKIDLEKRDVTYGDKPLELTKMEYDLLRLLAESPEEFFLEKRFSIRFGVLKIIHQRGQWTPMFCS